MVGSWRQYLAVSTVAVFFASCGGNVGMSGRNNNQDTEKSATKPTPKAADSTNPEVVDEHTSGIIAKNSDEELSAVPPESIAGAYLTCDTIASDLVGRQPATGNGYYGCSAYKVDDSRLDLKGKDVTFSLRLKSTGLAIAATRVELAERSEDAVWEAASTDLAAGVTADMTVKGTDGKPYQIKKRGSTTINDGTP